MTALLALVQATAPAVLNPAGPAAARLATLGWYLIIMGAAVAAFVLVLLVLALRRRGGGTFDEPPETALADRETRLWVIYGGTLFPIGVLTITLVFAFVILGSDGSHDGEDRSGSAPPIEIAGRQWWWEVRYSELGIVSANELHIPAGAPVRVRLRAADVIHSLWVPQLQGKLDMIPGKANEIVLQASRPGVYRGECAEYCGRQHTNMALFVIAHEPAEFERWAAAHRQPARPPQTALAVRGAAAFQARGCAFCHTVRGTPARGRIGPDLTHVGSRRTIGAGLLPATRASFGGWIANPDVLKPGVHMPAFTLPGEELRALAAYLEELQ